jgi:UPF0176 protein
MYSNIAAYKFVSLSTEELPLICKRLKRIGTDLGLLGTVLLATEGINLFLAGEQKSIANFIEQALGGYPMFTDLLYKYSYSNFIPFKRLSVKIRNEIVTFKQAHIHPDKGAPYITSKQLQRWLSNEHEFLLLDTRNEFEYEIGSFEKAIHLNITNFREFPKAVQKSNLKKNKPIVTFCTGGIRCEKASAYLLENGFKEVYQLQGGILSYFEQCGNAHYQGHCFVFDDRMRLDSQLQPVTHSSCE